MADRILYTMQCGMWLWNRDSEFTKRQHPAMWYVALGWHANEFAQTSAILEFYTWIWFQPYHRSRHVILHLSAKFCPGKMTSCRFLRWWNSAILDFRGPIMGSLKSPCTLPIVNRHHSFKLLSFWENRFFCNLALTSLPSWILQVQ